MDRALILAEGLYHSTDAKTAHGLVRLSNRYKVVGVIDSQFAGRDAGEVLDGRPRGIKIYASLREALSEQKDVKYLIIGISTAGGKLPSGYREVIMEAINAGLNIVSGLHEFLSDDPEISRLAKEKGIEIIDVRKIFYNTRLFYTGKIREVTSLKVVVLGTDSAIGKRTTAWEIANELNRRGVKAAFVGTGQTAWMQGAKYCFVLDSVINDFVTGVLEHEVWRAFVNEKPDVIVVPSQGSLLHPVFPAGWEILTLLRPEFIVIVHAPGRKHLDGFPEYPMPDLSRYIELVKLLTGNHVQAVAINNENLSPEEVEEYIKQYELKYGVVACAPLLNGVGRIVDKIIEYVNGGRDRLRNEA